MYRRVRIYLVGVFLGCFLVYFTLIKGRGDELLGWMPKQRVLTELNKPDILKSDSVLCLESCFHILPSDFEKMFKDGNVNLSLSKTRSNPKVYAVEWENDFNESYRFVFELTNHYSRLIKIEKIKPIEQSVCDC